MHSQDDALPPGRTEPPRALGVLRVVGPDGSGKSMLITALGDALRRRGVRYLAAEALDAPLPSAAPPGGPTDRREPPTADATVLTLPGGGRMTLDAAPPLATLVGIARSAEPHAALLIVEERLPAPGRAAGAAPLAPCLRIEGGPADGPSAEAEHDAVLATCSPGEVAAAFARAAGGQRPDGADDAQAQRFEAIIERIVTEVAGRDPAEAARALLDADSRGDARTPPDANGRPSRGNRWRALRRFGRRSRD